MACLLGEKADDDVKQRFSDGAGKRCCDGNQHKTHAACNEAILNCSCTACVADKNLREGLKLLHFGNPDSQQQMGSTYSRLVLRVLILCLPLYRSVHFEAIFVW